jgi:hypothetical protein
MNQPERDAEQPNDSMANDGQPIYVMVRWNSSDLNSVGPTEGTNAQLAGDVYLPSPPKPPLPAVPQFQRRVWLPIGLFLLTCISTYLAGALEWSPHIYWFLKDPLPLRRSILLHSQQGLIYMGCVLGLLFAHEMGRLLSHSRQFSLFSAVSNFADRHAWRSDSNG